MIARAAMLITLATLPLQGSADEALTKGLRQFDQAIRDASATGFQQAAATIQQAAERDPSSIKARHWLATARFHHLLALQHGEHDAAIIDAASSSAIEALESTLQLDPTDAEAHAMLATAMGIRIEASRLRGIQLGALVGKHRKLAVEHGPQNPRVRYLVGTILLHTAKNDAERRAALDSLLLAETLYQKEAATPATDPRWGRDSCLAFIGKVWLQLRDPRQAADHFRKALAIQPNNPLAKAGLAELEPAALNP